jgi:regulator of replication initiation timing
MESSPKLLQELSGLTRNLDVLVKEIRESNKINSESQKTLSKTVENSVKKESQAAKKVSPESKSDKLYSCFFYPFRKIPQVFGIIRCNW